MAQTAKDAGVHHAIWSTFEDTRKWIPLSDNGMPTLMGKYKVAHFDAMSEAIRVFTDLGVPTTFLLTSFNLENLIYSGAGPQKGPDGKLTIMYPMGEGCNGRERIIRAMVKRSLSRLCKMDFALRVFSATREASVNMTIRRRSAVQHTRSRSCRQ